MEFGISTVGRFLLIVAGGVFLVGITEGAAL